MSVLPNAGVWGDRTAAVAAARPAAGATPLEQALAREARLIMSQKVNAFELIGIEQRNAYAIVTEANQLAGHVVETGSGVFDVLGRLMWRGRRTFRFDVMSGDTVVLSVERPWFWFFSTLWIRDGAGRPLGRIDQRFTILSRRLTIYGADGNEIAALEGPFFRPWTFRLMAGGQEVGRIEKKWSGLAKELFTEADNFLVTLPQGGHPDLGRILLGAALLVDFCYFENQRASGSGVLGIGSLGFLGSLLGGRAGGSGSDC